MKKNNEKEAVLASLTKELEAILARKDYTCALYVNEWDGATLDKCWSSYKELDALLQAAEIIYDVLCVFLEEAVRQPSLNPARHFSPRTKAGRLMRRVAEWAKDYSAQYPAPGGGNPDPLAKLKGFLEEVQTIPEQNNERLSRLVPLAVLSGCYTAIATERRERLKDALAARDKLGDEQEKLGRQGLRLAFAEGEVDTKTEELDNTKKECHKWEGLATMKLGGLEKEVQEVKNMAAEARDAGQDAALNSAKTYGAVTSRVTEFEKDEKYITAFKKLKRAKYLKKQDERTLLDDEGMLDQFKAERLVPRNVDLDGFVKYLHGWEELERPETMKYHEWNKRLGRRADRSNVRAYKKEHPQIE